MEPSTPTEETERPREQAPLDRETIAFERQSREPLQETTLVAGPQCAACGARLAADQRYCVECGQRRGPTLPASLAGATPANALAAAPSGSPRRGVRITPNTALIAGIGTLMLALATGVLIGRTSSPSNPKGVSVQYLAAPASATAPASALSSTGAAGTPTPTTPAAGTASSHKTPSSAAAAKVLKGKAPPKAVVKPGTQGHGPGYQQGKFTGKFFGGANSKKKEEEEELGEEEPSSSAKGKK
jgi:hypothetical protein